MLQRVAKRARKVAKTKTRILELLKLYFVALTSNIPCTGRHR